MKRALIVVAALSLLLPCAALAQQSNQQSN